MSKIREAGKRTELSLNFVGGFESLSAAVDPEGIAALCEPCLRPSEEPVRVTPRSAPAGEAVKPVLGTAAALFSRFL